jgi:hypothetical protein
MIGLVLVDVPNYRVKLQDGTMAWDEEGCWCRIICDTQIVTNKYFKTSTLIKLEKLGCLLEPLEYLS